MGSTRKGKGRAGRGSKSAAARGGEIVAVRETASRTATSDVMNLRVTPRARVKIDKLAEEYTSQKTRLVEKLLEWFAAQPRSIQHAVLTPLPDEMRDDYARALEAWAQRIRAGTTHLKVADTTDPENPTIGDEPTPG